VTATKTTRQLRSESTERARNAARLRALAEGLLKRAEDLKRASETLLRRSARRDQGSDRGDRRTPVRHGQRSEPPDASTLLVTEGKLSSIPRPGDRIIFERADSQYDVREISASGECQTMREGLSFEIARNAARRQLEDGHRLWVSHHSTPDVFGPFSRRPTASRRATAWWSH
jgi:hypothetical protein